MTRRLNADIAPEDLRVEQVDAIASLFAVLSDPTRLRILQVLRKGEATVSEIVAALDMKQSNASKHLNLMHQTGLLGRRRDGLLVRYMIRHPVVFALCETVCDHLRESAREQAKLFV
jgi:DNA-binding transcriptional ArsR family regulator